MTKHEMLSIVRTQLATDLNCAPDDFNNDKDSFVFVEARNNPGRRPFPRGKQHFEMYSMGKAVIVSATHDILEIVKPMLDGKDHYEAFSMPFVYGQGICYLPDLACIKPLEAPVDFSFEIVEQNDIPALYQFEGLQYALNRDVNYLRPDVLATVAKKDGYIVGIAGASNDCARMWQIGIDVLPEYRNFGIASHIVNRLTLEILARGYIPYYGAGISNIASQRVAHRAGYSPAWVCVYKFRFDGIETLPTS